ncbi:mediator complex, subunit Med7 [Boeremia exigua]|uniref:mediator complex, subunit Med7 n=1 Tax=Boeremia exigua TaxID=749465 RepID=UPI001E8EE9BC|nr:mediator complex, subunit Med7 [Boeremia exigua]KAH6629047.1 mediator complex, subunit Med7 [Boeremia exigua]
MAEDGPLLNFFPDPPPFFKHFTTENLDRLRDIENEASNGAEASTNTAHSSSKLSAEQILALPTELRYLIPPPPPSDDEPFHVFGEPAKSSGTNNFTQMMEFVSKTLGSQFILSDWTYTQLYPSAVSPSAEPSSSSHSTDANIDRQQYLNRFNRSILLEYLSLLGILALDPKSDHKDRKMKHILTLVCNMHALINEYRPHQARETLIKIMEGQVRRKKAEIEGVKTMEEKVRGVLEGFGRVAESDGEKGGDEELKDMVHKEVEQDRRRDTQKGMWDAMEEILGH